MQKQKFFEYLTYVIVIAFLFGLLFSESVLSISSLALLLILFLTGKFKEKRDFIAQEKTIWVLAGIYAIYLVGMFFCKDLSLGLWELKRYIFWAILPLSIALIPNVSEKKIWYLLAIYVFMVFSASIHASIRIVFSDFFQLSNVRDAAKISHVSLSIQVVFAVYVLLVSKLLKTPVLGKLNKWIVLLLCAWLVFFLGFQKSLNAWLALYFSGILFFIWISKNIKYRKVFSVFFVLFTIAPFLYVGWVSYNYFNLKEKEPDYTLRTASNNLYNFKTNSFQTENGYHVYWYVCNEELENAWNDVSDIKLDEKDASGYSIYYTLLRYMTSKGLKKDSVGVANLSINDIKNIEAGVANVLFVDKKYLLYPRIYQTIWELECYYHSGNPNNQSLSQRIEYLKATFYILKHNVWGIGTGNFKCAFDDAFIQINSKLKPELRNYVHNQYLNYIVKFGVLGFLLIMTFIVLALKWKKQFKNVLSLLLITIVGITCLGETTLETHVGLHFFLFFISIFMWHSPTLLKSSFTNKKNLI